MGAIAIACRVGKAYLWKVCLERSVSWQGKSHLGQKPHIVHWIWSLSLGGDAKNLSALAIAQLAWAKVSVMTLTPDPGIRACDLKNSDIEVFAGISEQGQLKKWVDDHSPSIVIFHRHGKADPVEEKILRVFHGADIPIFEYNTFARTDSSTEGLWTGHAHLSCSSMLQYANRLGVSPLSLSNHAAIGYGLDLPEPIEQAERIEARNTLGIAPKAFVALRLVRPDLRKWDPLPVLAAARLKGTGFPIQLLVRSVPASRKKWISQTLGKNVTLLEPTQENAEIRMTLAASDCLVNYSHIGETFGLALAEAMIHALPVIVNSTPQMDNAQVELCQYGTTGIIANSTSSVATALQKLSSQTDYARQLGVAGKDFIETNFAASIVEVRLRNFMIKCLVSKNSRLVSFIPVPAACKRADSYVLNQKWLNSYLSEIKRLDTKPGGSVRDWVDEQILNYLRIDDTLQYALERGPSAALSSLARRLKSGSLGRG